MPDSPLDTAHRLLTQAVDALRAATGPTASDADLLSVLTLAEGTGRRLDQITVTALADLQRRGSFADHGYRSPATALTDLLGCDRADAARLVTAADHVRPRTGLDATPLPPRLPATAAAFDTGAASLHHVEAIARVLGSDAAARLDPDTWAGAEEQLAAWIPDCAPTELTRRGAQLVDALDADGPEPDHREPLCVNELQLRRHRSGGGGRLTGRFDDPAMFDAIATVIDAHAAPRTADDQRTPAQRQAAALADACGYVLDHADSTTLPSCGGRRPHLSVVIRLEDLEARARAACLDLGDTLSPDALRMLACDAAVIPVVLNGAGQPLDVGRATRTIPDGLRRAVTVRDGGCARCGRPPSWCEAHHIVPWEHGGATAITNLVLLCRACHRLVHHGGWDVQLVGGTAQFRPPSWIDPTRRPRRRPPPLAVPA